LDRSWKIKKQLADGISTPEIDQAYQRFIDWGASGGKLLGAGGGGFLFMCVPPARQKKFKQYLIDNDITNIFEDFDFEGNIVTCA
jgi:D-glycero-alpha-D-manno-heptose-7-phosphate kinase